MGFGIALIGHAFLLLGEFGGAVIAVPLLAYGFFLASRFDKRLLYAAVSSIFMLPRGIINFLNAFSIIDINTMPTLNTVTFMLYLAAWFVMTFFWLTSIAAIARENGAKKLERQAIRRLYFTGIFILFAVITDCLNIADKLGPAGASVMTLQYIIQYSVIIINSLFMHTCFILITSEKQYEKDRQYIANENAKIAQKQQEDREKEAELIEKRKGKPKDK